MTCKLLKEKRFSPTHFYEVLIAAGRVVENKDGRLQRGDVTLRLLFREFLGNTLMREKSTVKTNQNVFICAYII